MGCCGGAQGHVAGMRQAPVSDPSQGEHHRPRSKEGTHPDRSSCVRNTETPSGSGLGR